MVIGPQFKANREKVDEENGVAVWRPVDPPEKHGIHGMHIVVGFDICPADGACPEDCPMDAFTWVGTPGHLEFDTKAEPTHKDQCIDYVLCVGICSVDAIDIDPGRAGRT